MRILVLGGTQFVGRHIVLALQQAGHVVSVLNRGRSRDELPADVERLRGDRDLGAAGLTALTGRTWDACVDVSGYTAIQVRASAAALRRSIGQYVFISAVSVYGDRRDGPIDEAQPLVTATAEDVTELNQETYGRLKVTCEQIVQEVFGRRCTLLRPQIVAGPYDPIDRFAYWVRRAMQPGRMLAPGDGSDHLQVIDGLDVARFVSRVCEGRAAGTFNLAGPRVTWADFIMMLGAQDVMWVNKEVLIEAGVTETELPLYRADGGPRSGLMHIDNGRALAAGLELTETIATIDHVREWLRGRNDAPALSAQREAELIGRIRLESRQAPTERLRD